MVDHGPQIKNDDQYDALRDEGMSKQKAARIANSNTHKTALKGGKASQYEQRTKSSYTIKQKKWVLAGALK
ncbi:DUF7218 family protein [Pseudoalteromonas espejiana]